MQAEDRYLWLHSLGHFDFVRPTTTFNYGKFLTISGTFYSLMLTAVYGPNALFKLLIYLI